MVIPSPAPFLRIYDGVIGGIAALLVTALIPRNPLKTELRDARRAVRGRSTARRAALAQALRRGDRFRAERGLEKARALTPLVDDWRSSLESGSAIARISPFLRRQRFELQRHERVRASIDLAVRNLRVIARRVVYVCDDGRARPVPADLLAEVARAAAVVARIARRHLARSRPRVRRCCVVATRLDPGLVLPDASLGDQNLVGGAAPARRRPADRDGPVAGRGARRRSRASDGASRVSARRDRAPRQRDLAEAPARAALRAATRPPRGR